MTVTQLSRPMAELECRCCNRSWRYEDETEKGMALILRQRHEEKEHNNE